MLTGAELYGRLRAKFGDAEPTYSDIANAVHTANAEALFGVTVEVRAAAPVAPVTPAAPELDHVVISRLLATMAPADRTKWMRANDARVSRAWAQRDNPAARMPGGN